MKKIVILAVLVVALVAVICVGTNSSVDDNTLLRIHIRADSNSDSDQAIKYEVKSAVVDYLTPYLAQCDSFDSAISTINCELDNIVAVANKVLLSQGFDYQATASIDSELFPTRDYNGYVVAGGVYDSLIINLGSGSGDNWWCVMYPPLCFVGNGTGQVQYASKIAEIIDQWMLSNG